MLIPISKILASNGRIESYNFLNTETNEILNMKGTQLTKALKDDNYDIRGFAGHNRLSIYFSNIGIAGENDGKQYYTVVKRKIFDNKIVFIIVDRVGKNFEIDKNQLISLMQSGVIIAGVILKSTLKVSSSIEKEFSR